MTNTDAALARKLPGTLPIILALLGVSAFLNFVDRGNLSIAAPLIKDELHLSASQLGILLSAFFWTYGMAQILAGWLVDRFNVSWVLAAGFFLWSAATGVTGIVHGFVALFVVRLILGIGESVAYPAYSRIFAGHFPFSHRGFANSVVAAGLASGPAFGMLAGGILMSRFGWRSFFVVLGFVSLLWLLPWFRWMPRGPGLATAQHAGPTPRILDILQQRSAWGTFAAQFCANYNLYFLIAWLPYYLTRERHFSMDSMAKIGAAVYLTQALSAILSGRISDRWIAAGSTQNRVRKGFLIVGISGAGVFLCASVFANPMLCVVFLILEGLFFGLSSANIAAVTQTLAGPRASGRWIGVQYAVANLSGVVASTLTGFAVDRTRHFFWAFGIAAGFCCASALCWAFVVGRIEPVQWGRSSLARVAGAAAETA